MITISFIGSDKNAGKTTVFNHIYEEYQKIMPNHPVCVTSTGISGETIDAFYGHSKPSVVLLKNSYFINAQEHIEHKKNSYEIIHRFTGGAFMKEYILAKCIENFQVILEGPNNKKESILMRKEVYKHLKEPIFLIDGSVDRQFVAHPDISDSLFFSLLISNNERIMQKSKDLLYPLSIPTCGRTSEALIKKNKSRSTKSILINSNDKVIYQSDSIPFLDSNLKKKCMKNMEDKCVLYLNGALSKSLFSFFTSFNRYSIVLDNFTLYQNISTGLPEEAFQPKLYLLNRVNINGIFTIEEPGTSLKTSGLSLPENVSVHNLFREKETAADFLSGFIRTYL